MRKWLNNNKYTIIISLLFILGLFYCSLNTFIVNDDLGYSFFYRSNIRITNIIQIIKNQISDYSSLSPRVFIHSIVQLLLIYGKNVWALLNPIVILVNGFIINKIVSLYHKDISKTFNILVYLGSFLIIISYKWLIYWVSGSVNYVWTSTLVFGFIYYYLKNGFNNRVVSFLIVLGISILHESTFIFTLVFIIFKIILDFILNKKVDKKDLLLFIPLIISGCFLFLAPSMHNRLGADNNVNLIKQLTTSLPVISLNLLNILNANNLVPFIFITLFLIKILKGDYKYKYCLISALLLNIVLIFIIKNNWLYFSLSILVLLITFCINHKDKRDNLSIIMISFYAISYSLCLTNEYVFGRSNYFFYIFLIFNIVLYLNDIMKVGNAHLILLSIILGGLLFNEISIYKEIGNIKDIRLNQIKEFKKTKKRKLYLKKAPKKYYNYQMDCNEPQSYYFAYKYYLNYYGLKDNTKIRFKE